MPLYDPRDRNALFTGFGLSEGIEPDPGDDSESHVQESPANDVVITTARENGLTVSQVEEMWARFSGNQVYFNLANVAVALVYFFVVHAALRALSLHLAQKDGPAQFTVMYQPAIWWGTAGVGGFCLAWEITIQIWSLFAKRTTIRLYRAWVKHAPFEYKGGLFRNQLRFWHWCAAILVLPITVASVLALNMHCLFGPSSVQVCGYAFKPCESIDYSSIRHVEFYPSYGHGKGRVASKVVVRFGDGRAWDSSHWLDGDVDLNLARFLWAEDPDRLTPDLPIQSGP